jgi:hypothetical protein
LKNDLDQSRVIFPIVLSSFNQSKINISNIENEILNFFGYMLFTKSINFRLQTKDSLESMISKGSLLQILYSTINILLELLPEKSDLYIEIKSKNGVEIIVKHSSTFVDLLKMKQFTKRENDSDVFLLDIQELFISLDMQGISYTTTSKDNKVFVILKENMIGSTESSNVIKFQDYK